MVLNSQKVFWGSLPQISLFYSFLKLKHPKSSIFGIDALSLCICMAQCHPSSQAFSHCRSSRGPGGSVDGSGGDGGGSEARTTVNATAADAEAGRDE